MEFYEVDPLSDPRWHDLTARDCRASIFHTPVWLEALRRTYGYRPIVFTTAQPRHELSNAIVCCDVRSWITGRRFVSLPFSDHCHPLVDAAQDFRDLISHIQAAVGKDAVRYFEMRPRNSLPESIEALRQSETYAFHSIDLSRSTDELNQSLHKDSIRRKIQRAQREELSYERGSSAELLAKFYAMFVMTRKRHGVPPTPLRWFRNVLECLGKSAEIRIASKSGTPVAGLFTLSHNKSVVYKYGASDARFSNLGGTPFLFWMTIIESKSEGFTELDLGRSDLDNEGLITFKDRLGGFRTDLIYRRIAVNPSKAVGSRPGYDLARKIFSAAPDLVRIGLGNLLYRHLG